MEKDEKILTSACSFSDVRPITVALPYPQIHVTKKSIEYANILGHDYAGAVSELSAITQYVNHENRLALEQCAMAKTILGIAMAEMIHLQMLGQLIGLLGGNVDFSVKMRNGQRQMWTPQYLKLTSNPREILIVNIESERNAVNQYRTHMKMINDRRIGAVLARIIQDEEYHIMILQSLMKSL